MKFKSLIFGLALIGIFFTGCEEDNIADNKEKEQLVDYKNFGKYHNKILNKYYSNNKFKSTLSFNKKLQLVDNYLSEVVDSVEAGDFLTIINNRPKQKKLLKKISHTESGISTSLEMLNNLKNNEEISDSEYSYFVKIIEAYENYPFQFSNLSKRINEIKENVINDNNISEKEKNNILIVINLSKSSIKYWDKKKSLKNINSIQGMPWYAKDAAGAMTGVTTGLVGYATAVGGPAGGAAALVGSAALSSCV